MGVSQEYLRYVCYPLGIKREWYVCKHLLLPTLIPLSGVNMKNMLYRPHLVSRCDKDSAIVFTTACLMSTFLETGVGAIDCKCNPD
jgi:hypothetical protein